jgi:hypothetical protein
MVIIEIADGPASAWAKLEARGWMRRPPGEDKRLLVHGVKKDHLAPVGMD